MDPANHDLRRPSHARGRASPDRRAVRDLRRTFAERFGEPGPTLLVRCPGRVNLIGEHIDYNGLPVLPMAIGREVRLLLRPRDDATVRIANLASSFGDRTFTVDTEIEPYRTGDWGNYAKAAARELARRYGVRDGFDAVLGSDLPPAAGLSSSSAVVIATGLALLAVADRDAPRLELADALAEAERYTGTRGGGMDQAICLCARAGAAGRVAFDPLRVEHVPVPAGWTFIVAHSGERAEKSGAAQAAYNRRTRECREALEAVARALVSGDEGAGARPAGAGDESAGARPAVAGDEGTATRTAGAADAEDAAAGPARRGGAANADDADAATAGAPATYPALLRAASPQRLLALADDVLGQPHRRRFRHVVTEAVRVDDAERALAAGDAAAFGRLMLDSHRSLRDDYEVSTPALDELVERACDAGALGARLTGAGFGGCVLALVAPERATAVLNALADRLDRPRGLAGASGARAAAPRHGGRSAARGLEDRLFAVAPAAGASVEAPPR